MGIPAEAGRQDSEGNRHPAHRLRLTPFSRIECRGEAHELQRPDCLVTRKNGRRRASWWFSLRTIDDRFFRENLDSPVERADRRRLAHAQLIEAAAGRTERQGPTLR